MRWIKWMGWVLVTGLTMSVFGAGMDVQFQNSPMKMTFSGEGSVVAEVTEVSVGTHVYNTIQSVQQNGDSCDDQ